MATITVGIETTYYSSAGSGRTRLNKSNPCTGTGTISTMKFYFPNSSGSGVKCGTFYGSSTVWSVRDYENIGNVAYGSVQTVTGLNCSASLNDLIGMYTSEESGDYAAASSGSGVLYLSGDTFSGTNTYSSYGPFSLYIYGEGTGEVPASGVEYNGVTISEWNGVAIASLNKA